MQGRKKQAGDGEKLWAVGGGWWTTVVLVRRFRSITADREIAANGLIFTALKTADAYHLVLTITAAEEEKKL